MCLEQMGLAATDCVFVDDQARNIDGARALGLRCVSFDVTRAADSCDAVRLALA